MKEQLYWSKRGEVACALHVPSPDSARWVAERWTNIDTHGGPQRIRFQCQHCAAGPIAHGRAQVDRDDAQRTRPGRAMSEAEAQSAAGRVPG